MLKARKQSRGRLHLREKRSAASEGKRQEARKLVIVAGKAKSKKSAGWAAWPAALFALFDAAVFLEETAASVPAAAKERDGGKRRDHHFGGGHLGLRGFSYKKSSHRQEIATIKQ